MRSDRGGAAPHTLLANRLDAIRFPELLTSEGYEFLGYDEFGSLSMWELPTGALVEYFYTTYQTSYGRPFHRNMFLRRLTIDQIPYEWTYTRYGDGLITSTTDWWAQQQGELSSGSNPRKVKLLDPFGNLAIYWFHRTAYDSNDCVLGGCQSTWNDGMLEAIDTYAGPDENAARLVRRESYEYTDDQEDFQFKWAAPGLSRVNAVAINSRKHATHTHTPQLAGHPGGDRHVVQTDWNTEFLSGGPGNSKYAWPPRARVVEEYDDAELYRSTYTAYPETIPWEFQGAYDYVESRDGEGNVISRTDLMFDLNRIKCQVQRASGTGIALLDPNCEDPAQVGTLALQAGDVATLTTLTYNESTEETTRNVVTHGFDAVNDRYESRSISERGILREGEYLGLPNPWLAVDRTIDLDTGRIISSRDPAGVETTYTWDDLGRLTRIEPESPELPIDVYYDNVRKTRVQQWLSSTDYTESVYEYDELGRLVVERRRDINGDLDFRMTEYDISGKVTGRSEWADQQASVANLKWTIFEYDIFPNPNPDPDEPAAFTDPLGRVSKVIRPDGSVTETAYEGLSTSVSVSGIESGGTPITATTIYTNDVFGRLVAVDSPGAGADASYLYDELNNLTEVSLTDPAAPGFNQTRRFTYDGLGRLKTSAHPESGTVEYIEYDARGKLLDFQNGQNEYFNEYDVAGRLVKKSVVIGGIFGPMIWPLVENTYDASANGAGLAFGKLTEQKSYRVTVDSTYLASTLKLRYGNGLNSACSSALNGAVSAYDGLNGRVSSSSMTIDPWNKEVSTDYCYDQTGATYLVGYPDFSASGRTRTTLSHLFSNGQLWGVQDLQRDIEYVEDISYHPSGGVAGFTRGNGVRNTVTRDDQGRPAGDDQGPPAFDVSSPANPERRDLATLFGCSGQGPAQHCTQDWGALTSIWDSGAYSYDGAGNIASIGSDAYQYDALNRLVGAGVTDDNVTPTPISFDMTYAYDGFGNMLQRDKQVVGGSLDTDTFTVDPITNRLVGYTYDANGNMIGDGTYDYDFGPDNRLQEVWEGDGNLLASYTYDANGYRVRTVADGIETYYFRDASGQLLSEFQRAEGDTSDPAWNRDYIYALGQTFSLVKNDQPAPVAKPRTTSVSSSSITFEWEPVADPDIASYMIWRETDNPMQLPETYMLDCSAVNCNVTLSFTETITGVAGDEFKYKVRAFDEAANSSAYSPFMIVRPTDGVAPNTPGKPDAEGFDGYVKVDWGGSSADDVQGYIVERRNFSPRPIPNWEIITATPVMSTLYTDHGPGITNGHRYRYRVRAVDTAGNESANSLRSDEVTPRDWVSPGLPTNLKASPGQAVGSIVITWDAVLDPDLQAYEIYRSDTIGLLGTSGTSLCDAQHTWQQVAPIGFCGIADAPATAYLDAEPSMAEGQLYYYTVRAIDSSGNLSTTPVPVSATTRVSTLPVPTLATAEFYVDEMTAPIDPVTVIHPYDNCYTSPEDDDVIGVRVRWLETSGFIYYYQIYRADFSGLPPSGQPVMFTSVGIIDPDDTDPDPQGYFEFVDTNLNGYDYQYYVVTVGPGGESAASTPADAIDVYDTTAYVRTLRGIDGRDSFPTMNARSRRVAVHWSRVVEQQLAGYHVYRRCEWESSEFWPWASHFGRDCVHSWVRLTDSPIDSVRVFEDRPGGMNGAYLYAVRPVGPGATSGETIEGPIFKVLDVDLTTNGNEGTYQSPEGVLGIFAQCLDSNSTEDIDTKSTIFTQLEIDRINAATKGAVAGDGAPSKPANASIEFLSGPADGQTTYAVHWDPNPEEDLAGYFVEMAGGAGGPWERVNDRPVAWWETRFDLKGLDYLSEGDVELGPGTCAHFRVIAVDDDGLESLPSDPIDQKYHAMPPPDDPYFSSYTPPECGGFNTAPPAPQDLVVSTETPGPFTPFFCENKLEWSTVPGASKYYVYRYAPFWLVDPWPNEAGYYFYRTQGLPATSCNGTTCTYIESGDLPLRNLDDNQDCPWETDKCALDKLEAYYVTAVYENGSGEKSGESPRSQIVFWNCSGFVGYDEGYVRMMMPQSDEERDSIEDLFGESPVWYANLSEQECESDPITVAGSQRLARLAPHALLGTTDPPYEILDLHVDHLGSTRLITNDLVQNTISHDYFPFGQEMSPIVNYANDKMFTGHERDSATGLDYMFARYYSNQTARFLSVDPGIDTNRLLPLTWNQYSYVRNNPISGVDLSGEATFLVVYGKSALATGHEGRRGDVGGLFKAAAHTRAREIQTDPFFAKGVDKVEVVEVGTGKEFVDAVNAEYSSGPLASIDVFSHAWGEGMNFGDGPVGDDDKTFNKDQVSELKPELANGATCQLYGCGTASGTDNLAEAMSDQLGIPVSGSTTGTDFDNENPTSENPDVRLQPANGGQTVTVQPSGG